MVHSLSPQIYTKTPQFIRTRAIFIIIIRTQSIKKFLQILAPLSPQLKGFISLFSLLFIFFFMPLSQIWRRSTPLVECCSAVFFPPVFFWKEFIPSSSALLWHDFVLSRSNTLSSNTLSRGFSIPCQKALSRAGLELVPLRWMVKLFLMLFESRMVQVQAHACRCADQRA